MPELPEVETTRRGIEPYIVGQHIVKAIVRQSKLRWPIPDEIINLNNQIVLSVQRRAKYLLLQLNQGWIIIHLGMSGSLRVLTQDMPAGKHDHVDLILSNGYILRYTDPRRFGAWLWTKDLDELAQLAKLGPEPLSEEFNADYLATLAKTKKVSVKAWIMDNQVVVGVGNIYASESLFQSQILPERAVNSLTYQELEKLVLTIKKVLTESIAQGGTTLKDFLQADGKPGYFAQQLQVYGRLGEACFQCHSKIKSIRVGQRNTFYCPTCQR